MGSASSSFTTNNNLIAFLSRIETFEKYGSIPSCPADIELFVAYLKKKKGPTMARAHQPLSVAKVEVGLFVLSISSKTKYFLGYLQTHLFQPGAADQQYLGFLWA